MPERLPPKPATTAGQFDLFGKVAQRPVLSVSDLVRQVKGVVDGRFPNVVVKGEVSNLRTPPSGHLYFTLKDRDACLDCVIFAKDLRKLKFAVKNGMSLVARGRLSVYEAASRIELICDFLEPLGAGALQVAFEQLKARLQQEGLFDPARKRKLPFIPARIALVTSPAGAAVHDFLRVLHRRFPNLPVLVVPVRVQGDGAAQEIARGIQRACRQPRVEVVVVARGGGSLEDLWAFNEEVVARALAAATVPTVSAVGHEVDFTIADFTADVRAPTPTAAAELIARVKEDLAADLGQRRARLARGFRAQMDRRQAGLDRATARLADPRRLIGDRKRNLDRMAQRLEAALRLAERERFLGKLRERLQAQHPAERLHRLHREVERLKSRIEAAGGRAVAVRRHRYEQLVGQLDAMSPLRVLARGYAVAFKDGHAVRSSSSLQPGDELRVRFHEGEARAGVTAVIKTGQEP